MIDRNTVVVGVPPDLTLAQFTTILESASSPALVDAPQIYSVIVRDGVSPAFLLAIFTVESGMGTVGLAVANKNPGNTRSTILGNGIVVDTVKGKFVRYPGWFEGFKDLAARLIEPDYVYGRNGYKTIGQIIPVFAPASDGNSPDQYINSVIKLMNAWIQPGQGVTNPVSNKQLKIALSAGHHNTDGGSPVEHAITGPLCHYYAEYFRSQGHDVRVITPNDGLGDSPIGLQEVAHQVVTWAQAGWVADLYLETHTQGLNDSTVRGCFGIYPDWGGDLDSIVRNNLAHSICQAINEVVGIPIWQNGVMSERATGVGISGFRLGIFLVTAPVASRTTRLIIEHGAHTNPQDRAILENPAKQKLIAQAAAKAIINYFRGTTEMSVSLPYGVNVDNAGALIFPGNIPLNFGFKDSFLTLFGNVAQGDDLGAAIIRGVKMYGLPVKAESVTPDGSEQEFELCYFHFNKTEAVGWQLRLAKKSQLVTA
jgi:N-acetylmuramoyl-L-alanine amidase